MLSSHVPVHRRRVRQQLAGVRLTASLLGLARQHLRVASHSVARRSEQGLCRGGGDGLRQVLVAAEAGESLVSDYVAAGHR